MEFVITVSTRYVISHIYHKRKESPMKKQDPLKRQLDNIRVLIEEAKIRNNFSDEQLAACLGISDRTLRDKRADPSSLTFGKLLILLELTGRKIKFVEKE